MSWSEYLGVAIPCGLVTSLDVGLSNLALVRITMTFYTMVKSSSPIFVVLSAYFFGLEKITWMLILTVFIISAGELLTVMGEVEFDTTGFILVLMASVLSGMRWTVMQFKLQSLCPPLPSTLATMRVISPFMFASMLFLSFAFEEPWHKFGPDANNAFFNSFDGILSSIGLGLLGGIMAICMIMCEFYLIMHSSAIILMIGGVLKELTTILLGVTILHDKLNLINSLGIAVVFSGVILYKASLHLNGNDKESADDDLIYDSIGLHHTDSSTSSIQERDSSLDDDECDYSNDNDSNLHQRLDKTVMSRRVKNICEQGQNQKSESTERDAMMKEIM
jgi:solute carrier family 35 protein C2